MSKPLCIELLLPDASVFLWEVFLPEPEANVLYTTLRYQTTWQPNVIRLYGKEHPLPRLTAWYGEPDACYRYSGILNQPLPWTPHLSAVRDHVQHVTGHTFNSVLLNLYRSGADSVSWHADNEPEFGEKPVIASVSLGAVRVFQLRHRIRKDIARCEVPLPHGSLLLMTGDTQTYWQHRIPKTTRPMGARINLTFRYIKGPT